MNYRELLKSYIHNVMQVSQSFNDEYCPGVPGGDFLGELAKKYLTPEQRSLLIEISDEIEED